LSFEHPSCVRFRCERCALCCGDTEHKVRRILLLKAEAECISEKSLKAIDEFAEKNEEFKPYVYSMKKRGGRCVFLSDKSCSIYEIRPLICRFYPFQLKNMGGSRYLFTYTDECSGIGKGPYLKRSFFEKLFRDFTESMGDYAGI